MRRANVVWFDDDLRPKSDGNTPERVRLQTWLRWLYSSPMAERFKIVEVRDLRSFTTALRERATLPVEHDDRIDGLLIDQMWREKADIDRTFECLDSNFANERVKHLDAGVQLLGIMRNRSFSHLRPSWLSSYGTVPTAVFTTIIEYGDALDQYLDSDVKDQIRGILKRQIPAPSGLPAPCEVISSWFDFVHDNLASQLKQS
jgi:hypothetical protein